MANDKLAPEASIRLQEFARKKGFYSATELFEAMKSAGYTISLGGVRKHWYGKYAPVSSAAVDYCEFLEMSLDYYLRGKQAQRPSIAELKKIVTEMFLDAGGEMPAIDPEMLEIQALLSKVETPAQKAAIIRAIRGFVGES